MRRLIGFAGYRSSGKNEAAQALVERGWTQMAFADPLKAACREIFGFTEAQLHGDQKEVTDPFWGFTPRWAMQRLGTEGVRGTIGEDTWVRALEKRILTSGSYPNTAYGIAVTDCRFLNEVDMIHRLGGTVVLIDRSVCFGEDHTSESLPERIDLFDAVIRNTGTVADLHATVLSWAGVDE